MLIPLDYLVKKYNMHPKGVVHIGANEGQEAEAYTKAGIKYTFWVEALPYVYDNLRRHLSNYDFEAIIANSLLSDEDDKEVDFHIANNGAQSSSMLEFGTHTKEHPTVKYIATMKLVTVRFDTLMEIMESSPEFNLSHYDFLNVDVQGAELKVLKGMGNYLKQFKWLYLEINKAELYKGCPMVEEIDEYVKPFGFERVETKWTNWSWGDGFYLKQ